MGWVRTKGGTGNARTLTTSSSGTRNGGAGPTWKGQLRVWFAGDEAIRFPLPSPHSMNRIKHFKDSHAYVLLGHLQGSGDLEAKVAEGQS